MTILVLLSEFDNAIAAEALHYMNLLTPGQVVVRITAIVMLAETAVMALVNGLAPAWPLLEAAVLSALLLAGLATPVIYAFVILPFKRHSDEAVAVARKQALTDPLTKLANRRLFTLHLEKSVAGAYRHFTRGALLLIDLDGFKKVNDTFGHDAGDGVLVEFSRRLASTIRADDTSARLGGDEFAILISSLPDNEAEARAKAEHVAEKLIALAIEPVGYQGNDIRIGASVGIRIFGSGEELAAKTVIIEADVALYNAKRAGKGVAVVFEDQMVMPPPATIIGGTPGAPLPN